MQMPVFDAGRCWAVLGRCSACSAAVPLLGWGAHPLLKQAPTAFNHAVLCWLYLCRRELGCSSAEVLAELRYNLPATMRFHK